MLCLSIKQSSLWHHNSIICSCNGKNSSVVEHCDCDQYGLGSNLFAPFCYVLKKKHFTALSPAWRSWQAALMFTHISIKLKFQINISTGQ